MKISRIKFLEDRLMYNKYWLFTLCNLIIEINI